MKKRFRCLSLAIYVAIGLFTGQSCSGSKDADADAMIVNVEKGAAPEIWTSDIENVSETTEKLPGLYGEDKEPEEQVETAEPQGRKSTETPETKPAEKATQTAETSETDAR